MSESTSSEEAAMCQKTVLGLTQRLESILNSRMEPFNIQMLMLLPVSSGNFRITKGEFGLKVHALGDLPGDARYRVLLHEELSDMIATLESAPLQLPCPTILEKLTVQLRRSIWAVVDSGVSLFLVKHLVRQLTLVKCKLSVKISGAQQYHGARLHALSYLLQEPTRVTINLLCEHQYYLYWNYARRLRHLRKTASQISCPEDFCWPARDAYSAMNKDCRESRVLVTIHMGDFFGAYKCIAEALETSRPVISLRREGDAAPVRTLSPRHAEDHKVLIHGKENPLTIVRALRSGGQTLSVLFDLGQDFGETTEVTFMGQRACFVRGPAELAILGRARIYPFVSFSDAGRDWIHMESAFVPEVRAGENLQEAVNRVTQKLVTMAEGWIRQYPAQWKYLDRLPSYLTLDKLPDDCHA